MKTEFYKLVQLCGNVSAMQFSSTVHSDAEGSHNYPLLTTLV